MKTRLMRILSVIILTTFLLTPGQGLGTGRQPEQPHEPAAHTLGTTTRVSVASDGGQGNDESYGAAISADGRYIAFTTIASNLTIGDANNFCEVVGDDWYVPPNCPDVYVRDRQTGITESISVASDGSQGNDGSSGASISADGRFVAFLSGASNLVSDDTNINCFYGFNLELSNCVDVFVHDRQTGITERVSVASDGSQADKGSDYPSISADGRFVVFSSDASNLVSGDTNNYCENDYDDLFDDNCSDIFVHDRQTGVTERVSVASNGSQGDKDSYYSSISADGRYVAFSSFASNLVIGDTNNNCNYDYDGQFNDNCIDVFVHDRQTGITERVSISSDSSQGNYGSGYSSLSADGRFVAFTSRASNLVLGDTNNYCDNDYDDQFDDNCTDIFVHDRQTGITEIISISSDGSQANNWSDLPNISSDGRYVALISYASNLVDGDTNNNCDYNFDFDDDNCADVFVHDRETGITERVSVANDGSQAYDGWSYSESITADGRFVTFDSKSSVLVAGDNNGARDVFLRDREGITFYYYLPITTNNHNKLNR